MNPFGGGGLTRYLRYIKHMTGAGGARLPGRGAAAASLSASPAVSSGAAAIFLSTGHRSLPAARQLFFGPGQ